MQLKGSAKLSQIDMQTAPELFLCQPMQWASKLNCPIGEFWQKCCMGQVLVTLATAAVLFASHPYLSDTIADGTELQIYGMTVSHGWPLYGGKVV